MEGLAANIDQLSRTITQRLAIRQAPTKTLCYSGEETESFPKFIKAFNVVMNASGIPQDQANLQLPLYLHGRAQRAYESLPTEVRLGQLKQLEIELQAALLTDTFTQAAREKIKRSQVWIDESF